MITTTDTLQALTDAFNAAEIDTPPKVQAFVAIAALQVKLNAENFELRKLVTAQQATLLAQQSEREAKQRDIAATETALLAIVAAQAQ